MFSKFLAALCIALGAFASCLAFSPINSSAAMPVDSSLPIIKSPKATQSKYDDRIVVTWGKNKNSKVDKYLVMRKSVNDKTWHRLGFVSNSTNRYTDKISGDTKYYKYKVLCIKKVGGVNCKSDLTASGTAKGWCDVSICVDPGHYGDKNNNFSEKGADAKYPYSEAQQMLILGQKLADALESYHMTPIITRSSDDTGAPGVDVGDGGLDSRGLLSSGCDFFVSLHTNATGAQKKVWQQSENKVYVFANAYARSGSNFDLAEQLGLAATRQLKVTGARDFDGGLKEFDDSENDDPRVNGSTLFRNLDDGRDYYAVLRAAASVGTPGVLIEHSYHVNPDVRAFLLEEKNLEKLARAEAEAIAKHYGFLKR